MQAFCTSDDLVGIVSPDVATEQSSSSDDEEKPWQAFLPMITKEMSGPIFHCFLRRAAAILSSVDFSLPCLPPLLDSKLKSPVYKLTNASVGLLKMYSNTSDEAQRCSFLELVAKEKALVYYVIQLTCKVLQLCDDPLVHLWLIPLVGFLKLIALTLECCGDFKIQIEYHGLLIKLINHLKEVSLEIVQNLSEERSILRIIQLSVEILFQCAANCSSMQSKCIQHNCSQALLLLLQAPDIELRLITRAFLSCLSNKYVASKDIDTSHQVLRDDEISKLIEILSTESPQPISLHGFSYQLLLKMMEYFVKATENVALFLQWGIPSILDPLSDRLKDEEDKEKLAQLIWRLMQFESGGDFVDGVVTVDTPKFEVTDQDSSPDILPEEVLESLPQAEATAEFTEVLLHYLTRTLLPYGGIPLEHGFEQLSEATWYTISECILLMSMIVAESDGSVENGIIQCAAAIPGTCASIQLAFYIGTIIRKEGLPKSVMTAAFDDLIIILLSWSDNRELAQEIAKAGFVQIFTAYLTTGLYLSSIFPWLRTRLMGSLFILFNISRDPNNYPALFFCNTIRELIPYVHAQEFDLASTAKFTLSSLYMHLDCDELLVLKFEDREAEYCIETLTSAINSPDFTADGISVFEFLEILTNMTHPYQSAEIKVSAIEHPSKKKEKPVKLSYFDQKMLEAAEELVKNSLSLIHLNVISLLESIFKEKKFQAAACKLLWNLLHQENVKKEVLSNHPGIYEALETMKISAAPDDQLSSHCCLWLLESSNNQGIP